MMEENAVLTGSYAYGTPTEKSDIDIAVLMEPQAAAAVVATCRQMKAATHTFESNEGFTESQTCEYSVSVRLGKFNLIVCSRPESFQLWVDGTRILREARPVTRDHAISVFHRLRMERGL